MTTPDKEREGLGGRSFAALIEPQALEAAVDAAQLANRQTKDRMLNDEQRDAMERASRPQYRAVLTPAITAYLSVLSKGANAPGRQLPSDKDRMDWLERQVVNVRKPLRYGSEDMFWASPEDADGDDEEPSSLREEIDRARQEDK